MAVEQWLRVAFPDEHVESGLIKERRVVLFRASRPVPKSLDHEIEISYEAFQDHDTKTILRDLEFFNAARRLRDRSSVRLMYNRHRQLVETDRHS